MEPKQYVTTRESTHTRIYTRGLLLARAANRGLTLKPFVVRIANECYACVHHSRRGKDGGCSHRCNSDAGPHPTGCDFEVVDQSDFSQ